MKRTPHLLAIQSHVVFGHAGNSAAVFPMQRIGVNVWPLNTVQFSNHTQYKQWTGEVLAPQQIPALIEGIAAIGELGNCDAVLSGYLGSAAQGRAILTGVARIKAANPKALYLCEAHCISEWGHNFRPDYLKLPDYQREFNIPQALLLTATATPQVITDMQDKFAIAPEDVITTGFYRANLHLWVKPVSGRDKRRLLVEWLNERRGQPTIVYVTLQKTAEHVAGHLEQNGLPASAYHAGLPNDQRESIQKRFMGGSLNCIVATIAFGMGIDKSDIRNVVHFDLPKSIENYSQEIGRAGRDGGASDCLVLANRDSLNVLESFVYGDTPEREGIARVLEDLLDARHDGQWEFLLGPLADLSNIRQLPLKTLLVQLELRGIIAPRYAYFAEYRFKFLLQPHDLMTRFEGERREFVQALIDTSSRARTWATVNFDAMYQQYGAERGRVVKALDYFQEKGWIELESKQMTEVYSVLRSDFDPQALSVELHDYFAITRLLKLRAFMQCLRCSPVISA